MFPAENRDQGHSICLQGAESGGEEKPAGSDDLVTEGTGAASKLQLGSGHWHVATTEAVSVADVRPQAEGQDVPVWPLVWQRCGVAFCKMLDNYRGWKNRMKKVHRAASLGARKHSMESTQNVCSNRRFPLP